MNPPTHTFVVIRRGKGGRVAPKRSEGGRMKVYYINGCAYLPGGTDLSEVADSVGLANITTGDEAMINVIPHQEAYYGIPFGIIGLYVDGCQGTGIKMKTTK